MSDRQLNEKDHGWHAKPLEGIDRMGYFSKSKLHTALKSPRAFHRRYILGTQEVSSSAQEFGKICHQAILEPNFYLEKLIEKKKFSGTGARTKAKEWAESLPNDSIVLSGAEIDKVRCIVDSVQSHPLAEKLLKTSKKEVTGYAYDSRLEAWFMVVVDMLHNNFIGEVKTTRSSDPKSFARDMASFHYLLDAAVYCDVAGQLLGKEIEDFFFLAVETSEPFTTEVYRLEPHNIEVGRQLRDIAVKRIRENLERSKNGKPAWPGYTLSYGETPIEIPQWAYYEIEQMEEAHDGA